MKCKLPPINWRLVGRTTLRVAGCLLITGGRLLLRSGVKLKAWSDRLPATASPPNT